MNLADCGHGVWVGECAACEAHAGDFERIIHIWRTTTPPTYHCRLAAQPRPSDLSVGYYEGRPLAEATVPLETIVAFCRPPGKILIHCQGGLCRGPTLALIALAARGVLVYDALGMIARAIWRQYETAVTLPGYPVPLKAPHWQDEPFNEILARFDPPGPRPAILIEGHDGNPSKDLRTAHAVCAELRARGHAIEVWGISQVAEVRDRYPYDRFWHAPDVATMRRVYSDATLLLKTSVFEGRPLAPAEAMACGCPVVATDCLGTDDFEGVSDVRPVGDVRALATACAAILNDPARRRAMAQAGLDRVAARLRWPAAIDDLERLYGLTQTAELARGSIAVLLPTRDRPHLIGRALASLQAQTRTDWTGVVVVNGNRDPAGYAAALAPFRSDPRIKIISILEEGIPHALNAGLAALPPTDYFAVLEDDDEWHPDFLEALSLPLDRDPSLALAYADLEERGIEAPLTRPPAHGEYDRCGHLAGNWICFPMMLGRRKVIATTGGFDETTGGCCDWDTGLRLAAAGGVRRVRRKLTVHWWHAGTPGSDQNTCQDLAVMRPGLDRIAAKRSQGLYTPRSAKPRVALGTPVPVPGKR